MFIITVICHIAYLIPVCKVKVGTFLSELLVRRSCNEEEQIKASVASCDKET